MADKTLRLRIQQKYDTVVNWRNSSLVLLLGELALDDTNGVKIGDGIHTWNYLPYITDDIVEQLQSSFVLLDNKIDNAIIETNANLNSAVVLLNEKINDTQTVINGNMQSIAVSLNDRINNLELNVTNVQNDVNQINTEIQQVIDEEIPTSSLVNPADPEKVVIIDCGTASSDSKE